MPPIASRLARAGLAAVREGDMLRTQLAVLRRFLKRDPANTVAMRQRISAAVEAGDRYPFEGRVRKCLFLRCGAGFSLWVLILGRRLNPAG